MNKIDMVIEVKRPDVKNENISAEGESSTPFQQMQSYCRAILPHIGVSLTVIICSNFMKLPHLMKLLLLTGSLIMARIFQNGKKTADLPLSSLYRQTAFRRKH